MNVVLFLFYNNGNSQTSSHFPGSVEPSKDKPVSYKIKNSFSNNDLVNLYTGMLNVNLNILDPKYRDINLPISLNYKKDGIKVNERDSEIGLGWTINAGGYIIRELRGNPDENLYDGINESNFGRFCDLSFSHLPNTVSHGPFLSFTNGNCFNKNTTFESIKNYLLENETVPLSCYTESLVPGNQKYQEGYIHEQLFKKMLIVGGRNWDGYNTQPDIFHYSVPNFSGSFVLDSVGAPLIISGNPNVKILPAIGPLSESNSWVIITPNGLKHNFLNNNEFTETSFSKNIGSKWGGVAFFGYDTKEEVTKDSFDAMPNLKEYKPSIHGSSFIKNERFFISKWNLSSIQSLKTKSQVNLTYKSINTKEDFYAREDRIDYIRSYQKKYLNQIHDPNNYSIEGPYTINYHNNRYQTFDFEDLFSTPNKSYFYPVNFGVSNPKILSSIIMGDNKITFESGNNYNNQQWYINNIKLINNDKEVKSFHFEYEKFQTNDDRIKLKSFYQISNNIKSNKYDFTYYDQHDKLPPRYSSKQDLWGYYNNNTSNSLIVTGKRFGKTFSINTDRTPELNKAKTFMLKKIQYPTKGYKEFFYDLNTYSYTMSGLNRFSTETAIGGLRVSKIVSNDLKNEYTTNFEYKNGTVPHYIDNWNNYFQADSKFYLNDNFKIHNVNEYLKRSSHTTSPLKRTKGGIVGYENVTVSQNGNGKTYFSFRAPLEINDEKGEHYMYPFRNRVSVSPNVDRANTSKDALRGLLTSKIIYNEKGQILTIENYEYSDLFLPSKVYSIDSKKQLYGPQGYNYSSSQFVIQLEYTKIPTFYAQKKKMTIKNFFYEDNNVREQNITENYYYNSNRQLNRIEKENSKGDLIKTEKDFLTNSYINTHPNEKFLDIIKGHNRLSDPISVKVFKNSKKLFERKKAYNKFGDLYLTSNIEASKGINPLEKQAIYQRYDIKGNLVESRKNENSISSVYLWGYDYTLLIAKIEGATYAEVLTSLGKSVTDDLSYLQNLTNSQIESEIHKIRKSLPNSNVTTYTHIPYVGNASIIDSRGEKIYYEYDIFNRLQFVKDKDGNILKETKYNYKN